MIVHMIAQINPDDALFTPLCDETLRVDVATGVYKLATCYECKTVWALNKLKEDG